MATRATDPLVRILYDLDTGVIRYDDDGSGVHRARIVAISTTRLSSTPTTSSSLEAQPAPSPF